MNRLKTLALYLICVGCLCHLDAVDPPFIDDNDQSDVVPKWHRLVGRRGEKGHRGKRGKKGEKGKKGRIGFVGPQGLIGLQGATGLTGPQGPTGPTIAGPMGPTSSTGPTGPTGATGAIGPGGMGIISAYGSAHLPGPTGSAIQILSVPLTVPLLSTNEEFNNIIFNDSTNTFTVGLDGVYAIDYSVQILFPSTATTLSGPPATMEVFFGGPFSPAAVADELIPVGIFGSPLTISPNAYKAVSTGMRHIVRTLYSGNVVNMKILSLPTGLQGYFDEYGKLSPEVKVVASLSLHKIN